MVTLKDVANKCGVSVASVSKALNNMPDISSNTATRIRSAAKELGYYPNGAARALKTSRSRTIGIMFFIRDINVWEHEYFTKIISSIQRQAERNGYDITIVNSDGLNIMGSYLAYCRYRNYDGVIVTSAHFEEPTLMELVQSDLPVVTIDYLFNQCSAVISDNVQGIHDLVRHVCQLGHRRIAYIHGEDTMVTRKRVASFYKTCEELSINVPAEYIINGKYHDRQSSVAATRELVSLKRAPTCILYPDDFSCIIGMNELKSMGYDVPEDMSVVGYDGIYMSEIIFPKLTTLKQNTDGIGTQVVRMLLKAIDKKKSYFPKHIVLPGILQLGETVKDMTSGNQNSAIGRIRP